MLLFEYPMDELTRFSLRLEFLVKCYHHHLYQDTTWSERSCISAIVNILNILDRPDLKSKYARDISIQIQQLNGLLHHEGLDLIELNNILSQLKEHLDYFSKPGKIGLALRENFFLNSIRQHLLYPGGEADFELPSYCFWLHMPRQEKIAMIDEWFQEFRAVIQPIELLLKLTRGKTRKKKLLAISGFHPEPLDSKNPPKLIQIGLTSNSEAYPSISAGKHRINIRFNEGKHLVSKEQASRDIEFELTLCC